MSALPIYAAFGSVKHDVRPEEIEAVYDLRYSLPGDYGTGDEFPTLALALAAAEKIARKPLRDDWAGGYHHPRVFVDRRVKIAHGTGAVLDLAVDRIEVFLPAA